jgi:hypothetical protein
MGKIIGSANAQSIVQGGCTQLPSGKFKNLRLIAWVRLRFGSASRLYLALRWFSRIFAPSNKRLERTSEKRSRSAAKRYADRSEGKRLSS